VWWAVVFGLGCKAASVGVEVPKGGAAAISMEDLRRDSFLLEAERKGRTAGTPRPKAGWQGLADRLGQMKTVPAFGRSFRASSDAVVVCSEKKGGGDGVIFVGVEDDPADPGRATAGLAMLISLAKAWDTRAAPPRTLLFCAWEKAGGFDALRAAPPVPWRTVDAGLLLGSPARNVDGLEISTAQVGFSGSVEALDFQALHRRTLEVEQDLRSAVTADP
jgi:hypothetical protein